LGCIFSQFEKHKSISRSLFLLGGSNDDRGIVSNSAEILASGNLDVSIDSPSSSPGVSHIPGRSASLSIVVEVSSQLHAVINLAAARSEDSSVVVLPAGGINADGDGSSRGASGIEARFAAHSTVAADGGNNGITGRELARARLAATSSVWVVGIGFQTTSALDVLVGSLGVSSIASTIGGIAIDDLFHGEGSQGASSKSEPRFDGLSGRESPARAALSLVVDGGGNSSRAPVPVVWVGSLGESEFGEVSLEGDEFRATVGNLLVVLHQVLGSELIGGDISKGTNSKGSRSVVLFDQKVGVNHVGGEDLESSVEFLLRTIVAIESGLELDKG